MSPTMKLVLGAILGYAGFMAYKKYKGTSPVIVDTVANEYLPGYSPDYSPNYNTDNIAGLPRGLRR